MSTELTLMAGIASLAKSGQTLRISANPDQLRVISERIGVLEIQKFEAEFTASSNQAGVYLVKGALKAQVTQACVRTLSPVKASVDNVFVVTFMAEKKYNEFLENEQDETLEDVELLAEEKINLAEIAVQYLSLSLDPYPMSKEGLDEKALDKNVTIKSEDQQREESSPFAVLKKLDKKG